MKKYRTKEQILKDKVNYLEDRLALVERKLKHFKKLVLSVL